jgi:hypothetical protein
MSREMQRKNEISFSTSSVFDEVAEIGEKGRNCESNASSNGNCRSQYISISTTGKPS